MRPFSISALLVLSVTVTSCENRKAEAASVSASAAVLASAAPIVASPSPSDSATKVDRIVFVGKEHACDCTRKKVDAALAALQQVLGTPAKIPVEMLKVDTEEEKVEPYRKQKPMMAVPAIYFIDSKGGVVEMLQDEVTAAQVGKLLGMPATASGGP
jgi:hypothetical protein